MDKEPNNTLKDAELVGSISSTQSGGISQYLLHAAHQVQNVPGQPEFDADDVFRFDHSSGEELTSVTASLFGAPTQPEFLHKGGVSGEVIDLELSPLKGLTGDSVHLKMAFGSYAYGDDLKYAVSRIEQRASVDGPGYPEWVKPLVNAIDLIFERDGVNRSGKQVASLLLEERGNYLRNTGTGYDEDDITYWVDIAINALRSWEQPRYGNGYGFDGDAQTWLVDSNSTSSYFQLTGQHIYSTNSSGAYKAIPVSTGFQINLGSTVLDNKISMSTGAVRSEGSSGSFSDFTFTAKMTYAVGVPVTVKFAVKGSGTHAASAGDFYGGALPSGKLTFAAGQTTATFTVKVAADTLFESNETFTVTLSEPNLGANFILTKPSQTGTIVNDDLSKASVVSIAALDNAVIEGTDLSSTLRFRLTLDKPAQAGETISYYTKLTGGVTASDFVSGELPYGKITFKAGELSRIIEVSVRGDRMYEKNEKLIIGIEDPSSQLIVGKAAIASVAIINDDPQAGDDFLDTTATSGGISSGHTVIGSIDGALDSDWFNTKLSAGISYIINARSKIDPFSNLDVAVHDRLGDVILRQDNAVLDGVSPKIIFTPFESGGYYLSVQQYLFLDKLSYGLSLKNVTQSKQAINIVLGKMGNNEFFSGHGDDVITYITDWGGTVHGNSGNDRIIGQGYGDFLFGDRGNDVIRGGGGNDEIHGDNANFFTPAPTSIDVGGTGADKLFGEDGDDQIYGDDGNDFLTGGAGADDLFGGKGADRFIFKATIESSSLKAARDTIFDFSHAQGDKIDLSDIDADSIIASNQDFLFVGTAAFSGAKGELRYAKYGGDTYVYGDVNGDKAADLMIKVFGSVIFTASDFIL